MRGPADTLAEATGFDRIAVTYQDRWSATEAGRLQREAVWSHAANLFTPGTSVLDLGCGTGDDALLLSNRGVHVTGIDSSPEMVRIARGRGVDARLLPLAKVGELRGTFHGAYSNFGALNCVADLHELRRSLAPLIRPGGSLALCLMSRVCLWETLWYTAKARPARAIRRWGGEARSSLTPRVFYPSLRALRRAFEPEFTLLSVHGIGVAVPPSYVPALRPRTMQRLAAIDRRISSWPIARSLGDHRLLIFYRGTA